MMGQTLALYIVNPSSISDTTQDLQEDPGISPEHSKVRQNIPLQKKLETKKQGLNR